MKKIRIQDAAGMVLVHDLTQIIPGDFKGARFTKGYIVQEDDIELLLNMGKKHLYVVEKSDLDVHENDAATRIATAAAGGGITFGTPKEGKVELFAAYDGLLKINTGALANLIDQDEIMFATIHENQLVNKGDKVAGTRVIPLFVNAAVVEKAEKIPGGPLIEVKKLQQLNVGIVTTGSEIYTGRIQDAFGPVLKKKFEKLGSVVTEQLFADDDDEMIADCIQALLHRGAELISVTGGMSVDPDDRTPAGIRKAGGHIVTYGAPVLPGAMFLLAYIGKTPVVGLPGCVMYNNISIFDLIVPRILAGETLSRGDVKKLAHGGLCQNCAACTYPNCGFGKT